MTIEEKAKAYDEALEKAKKYMKDGYTVLMPDLFPELKETEDERMLKKLIEGFKNYIRDIRYFNDIDVLDILNFLEKQKNKKFAMIQWTGKNLKEVIDFTGKSQKFGEWFKSWEEYEKYVYSHGNILKLFKEDGSHYEVPVGAWIVKTPDGYNIPSRFRFIQKPSEWRFPYGKNETVDKLIAIAECLEMDGDTLWNGYKGTECGKLLRDLARKQVECKPAEWSEEDEVHRNFILELLEDQIRFCKKDAEGAYCAKQIRTAQNWLKSLRPQSKQAISKDTEVLMAKLVNLLKSYRIGEETATALANRIADTYGAQRYMDGLCDGEKLHWKPSEEQMEALETAERWYSDNMGCNFTLVSLVEQLKKL